MSPMPFKPVAKEPKSDHVTEEPKNAKELKSDVDDVKTNGIDGVNKEDEKSDTSKTLENHEAPTEVKESKPLIAKDEEGAVEEKKEDAIQDGKIKEEQKVENREEEQGKHEEVATLGTTTSPFEVTAIETLSLTEALDSIESSQKYGSPGSAFNIHNNPFSIL